MRHENKPFVARGTVAAKNRQPGSKHLISRPDICVKVQPECTILLVEMAARVSQVRVSRVHDSIYANYLAGI